MGDAHLHPVVDDGDAPHQRSGTVPAGNTIPALLQLSHSVSKGAGEHPPFQSSPTLLVTPRHTDPPPLQYWRLLTTFLYFGPISIDLLFNVYFLQRYARLLEESSGRSPAHFSWLLVYAMTSLLLLSPFVSMPFLGHPLSSTLVYIWSRRNPDMLMSFLGLLVFRAPYLPWVLMGISFVMHGTIPRDEFVGVAIGHVWYFFNDVYPPLHGGSRPLDPPMWWRRLFGE